MQVHFFFLFHQIMALHLNEKEDQTIPFLTPLPTQKDTLFSTCALESGFFHYLSLEEYICFAWTCLVLFKQKTNTSRNEI